MVTVLGAGLAWCAVPQRHRRCRSSRPARVVTAARRNLYADAFNEAVFEKPGIYLTRALVYLDNRGIDGLVNGLAAAVGGGSGRLRRLQTGFVRSYALSMLAGALLVVGAFLAVQTRMVGVTMADFPFLSVLTVAPLVGALVVAFLPAHASPSWPSRSRSAGRSPCWCSRVVDVARLRGRRRPVPVPRVVPVDPDLGRRLHVRRRRHRAGDAAADRGARAAGDPGLLARRRDVASGRCRPTSRCCWPSSAR